MSNAETNYNERKNRIESSEQSMSIRYKNIIGFEYCPTLYQSCLDDSKRKTITRWRLSSHKLRIETGRYSRPFIERENRLCKLCNVGGNELLNLYKEQFSFLSSVFFVYSWMNLRVRFSKQDNKYIYIIVLPIWVCRYYLQKKPQKTGQK